MKNIKIILCRDLKALFTHFFVFVIAIGLCILPALYAWLNIYSNTDPYGNTEDIKIAVASEDLGFINADGENQNVSEEILKNLKENKSIHWVDTTRAKAKEGVKSGEYYAAVVFSKDFSKCMYEGVLEGLKRPKVYYYDNEKKNAVAIKITDTAVSNLKNNINEMYISILVTNLFEKEGEAVQSQDTDSIGKKLNKKLNRLSKQLVDYQELVDTLVVADERMVASLDAAKSELSAAKQTADKSSTKLKKQDASDLSDHIVTLDNQVSQSMTSALTQVYKAANAKKTARKNTYYKRAVAYLKDARTGLSNMQDTMRLLSSSISDGKKNYSYASSLLETQIQTLDRFIATLQKNMGSEKDAYTKQQEAMWQETLEDLESHYDNVLDPLMQQIAQKVNTVTTDLSSMLESVSEDMVILEQVLTGAQSGVKSLDGSLKGISNSLDDVGQSVGDLNSRIQQMSNSEIVTKFKEFLKGDPEGYGKFFSTPVKIETKAIYPVENYGTGVAPFYTTLALWVGGIFLVALIKVNPSKEGLIDPKPHELFLGRFLLFFLLGQFQAAVIVWGDLNLLHIQCLSIPRFMLASSIASFTFMILIYSCTIAFGDIGKALVVVLVVIQIAGSSGTYPIEILPEFYQKVYIFFPFPYSINAMREALCGMYEHDYLIYLMQLLLFAVVSLLVGLVIRLPFIKVYHFVERRMNDTGFM